MRDGSGGTDAGSRPGYRFSRSLTKVSLVPVFRSALLFAVFSLAALTLSACGRRGPLEPPPGEAAVSAKRAAQAQNSVESATVRGNTFFNPSVTPEPLPKDDIDPNNLPLNPQLGVGGAVTTPTRVSPRANAPGIAPVGGGSKAKRILPKQDSFILDPLL